MNLTDQYHKWVEWSEEDQTRMWVNISLMKVQNCRYHRFTTCRKQHNLNFLASLKIDQFPP